VRRPAFVCRWVGILLLGNGICFSQYPAGQPGQYPPGQYPPGQYPNTYPARLPGGIPVNIPVPEIKLPKRGSKGTDEKSGRAADAVKITVGALDGVLRNIGEKELFLQIANNAVLGFRLLVKTQFRDKDGGAVRDSLLRPGDRLTVEVNTDDEETALRVILLRSGTPTERSAAEKPVDPRARRAPTSVDFRKARTITAAQTTPPDPDAENDPNLNTGATTASTAPESSPIHTAAKSDEQWIASARSTAESFRSNLPNFIAEQVTTRYFKTNGLQSWRTIDVITAEVAYHDGRETYANFRVDGVAVRTPPERSGSWTTGEFGSTLEDVLSRTTNATFKRRGEEQIEGRTAIVFDYAVQQSNSHWTLVSADDRHYTTAYDGAIWIDTITSRVLRIEQRTVGLPKDFSYSSAAALLEYGFFSIDNHTYILPARGDNSACMNGSGSCSRNVLVFRNFRKFSAESVVKFKFAGAINQ